ncbi:MAG: 4-(cytidine 5'-diphospho)-2-C-methyl-D-erythritol kinase [Ruminococcaceae bacterium]|nr:4-(cytidine 5'-diphospho)-2-C-methyl-D-erythritol kinase [Oscillospiraceae bacterium]
MNSITINAYAKINLFLEVCEKRPDSYHDIDSIMHSVSLCDVVTISKNDCLILSNSAGLHNDEKNIAYKAAKLFFEHTEIENGAKIAITKNIPISAGLAGGSTDAAAVLMGLNAIYDANLSIDILCELGSKLGADVPFCIRSGCYITKGIGDIFTPCAPLPECFIVISKSGEGVSTPYAYNKIDLQRSESSYKINSSDKTINALNSGDLSEIKKYIFNAFESVVCPERPKVQEQKNILLKHNAVCAMMSGSGPSVFGIFDSKINAENALDELKEYGANCHLCTPIYNK